MIYFLTHILAHAETSPLASYHALEPKFLNPTSQFLVFHGPDGPPPDGGYTIRDDEGGNFFGKLGGVCLGAGLITGVLSLTTEEAAQKKEYENMTIGFLGAGVGMIILERSF